ncbi:MAG: MarR family transcriptional regulator [Acidiferrobacteraceae bacterium]|nr:MarR family transcriptional regulator [Acidiferrobacteraceae bacterium]
MDLRGVEMTQKIHIPPDLPLNDQEGSIPKFAEIGLDQFAPYLMNRITNRWNASILKAARQYGLTTRQMRTLAVLSDKDGRPINELATLTVTNQSTMSRAVVSMERKGFIIRRPRSGDSRFIEVYLTDKGRGVFERFWPIFYWHFRHLFHGIGDSEFTDFVTTLHKILNNVRHQPF